MPRVSESYGNITTVFVESSYQEIASTALRNAENEIHSEELHLLT